MTDALGRLTQLFATLGLDVGDGTFTLAEIKGYCAGITAVAEDIDAASNVIFSPDRSEYAPLDECTRRNFTAALRAVNGRLTIDSGDVVITGADPYMLGQFWRQWGYPFTAVRCNGNGAMWITIDGCYKTWADNDSLGLIWSMIDTMEVYR